jgi:hypothetical protein
MRRRAPVKCVRLLGTALVSLLLRTIGEDLERGGSRWPEATLVRKVAQYIFPSFLGGS